MVVYHDVYQVYELLHRSNLLGPPDAHALRNLLHRSGADVAKKEFLHGLTLLHKGLEQDAANLELVKILVQANPSALTHFDERGFLPLHYALNSQLKFELIQYLIEQAPETLFEPTKKDGALPVHLACYLPSNTNYYNTHDSYRNAAICQLQIVKYLVQLFPESLQHRDNHGRFPLYYAQMQQIMSSRTTTYQETNHEATAAIDDLAVLRYILQQYPLALEFVLDPDGDSPTSLADNKSSLPLHRVLSEQAHPTSSLRRSAQVDALVDLYVETSPGTLRLQGVTHEEDQDAESSSILMTPLAYACEQDLSLSQIYSMLRTWPEQITSAANLIWPSEPFNGELLSTLLLSADMSASKLQAWIQQSPYVVATPDSQGRLPLHYAAMSASSEAVWMVQTFLSCDDDHDDHDETIESLRVADVHGRTPLHYACASGNLRVVQYLVGLECTPSLWIAIDEDGRLPWHYAECARIDPDGLFYEVTIQAAGDTITTEEDINICSLLENTDLIPVDIRWDVLQMSGDMDP